MYFRLSPLQKHVRKVVSGFGKKICVSEKAGKHMCITYRHDMTLAVKVALTNQPILYFFVFSRLLRRNINQIRGNIYQILWLLLFLKNRSSWSEGFSGDGGGEATIRQGPLIRRSMVNATINSYCSLKHCGKMRNYAFLALSHYVKMLFRYTIFDRIYLPYVRVQNIVGKGGNACCHQFSFSHNVFKILLS